MTTPAIRIASEDDDFAYIEGYAYPFSGPFPGGRDSYRTTFTKNTDFAWDLFPDDPANPRFTRPVTYQHGFDNGVGLRRVGGWTPISAEDLGVWVQGQISKHDEYFDGIRELIEKDKLYFSGGSAEHSVRIDEKSGEILRWPAYELALTPTPSNPYATIAARAAELQDVIRIIDALDPAIRATDKSGKPTGPPEGGKAREDIAAEDFAGPDKSFPIVNQASVDDAASLVGKAADPDAVKAKITAIAKRKGLRLPDAWAEDAGRSAFRGSPSGDAAVAAGITQQLLFLRDCEMGEDDQVANIDTAINAVQAFLTQEMAEPAPPAYMSGVRQGKEISAKNQTRIDAIHQHASAIMAHTGAMGAGTDTPADDKTEPAEEPDAASRSADSLTVTITQRDDVAAVRARLLQTAAQVGEDTAKAMLD